MNVLNIPKDLFPNSNESLHIFDYKISKNNMKSKINLTKNVFSFLQQGTKEVFTNKEVVKIENNQFLFIKLSNCLMTEKISEHQIYHSVLLFFSDEMVHNFIFNNNLQIHKKSDANYYKTCDYDMYINNFVSGLCQISNQETIFQKKLLQIKFNEIMLYLVDKYGPDFLESFSTKKNSYEQHFENVVQNNKLNNLHIDELAFLCNMSVSTFKRHFEKTYNSSPIKWFQEQRLAYAAFLLQTTASRPTDIYLETGFDSLSSFSKAFKQKYKITPTQLQSQN